MTTPTRRGAAGMPRPTWESIPFGPCRPHLPQITRDLPRPTVTTRDESTKSEPEPINLSLNTVSQYFDDATTGGTLWNPATRVAQLFFRRTEALVPVANPPVRSRGSAQRRVSGRPSGVRRVRRRSGGAASRVESHDLQGDARRLPAAGGGDGRTQLAALTAPIERSAETISLNVDAFDPAADQRNLIRLAAAAERSMPTL
ncbi:hypothetical protein Asi03nite_65280 [Actinoplanes siamensis]|uniref:Uncharacterized protein n=1 Tax=Actinoplanes siamensis TaxID=1223317 RepID=A0A919NDZ8_9ACTN|nr:hypothetical protein Asi03nite_65280 [Actinoplanes siamensis]